MLSPAFLWRIQNLTSSLIKKNIKLNQSEINLMANSFADNGPVFALAALIDGIDFKEQKSGGKDSQKVYVYIYCTLLLSLCCSSRSLL